MLSLITKYALAVFIIWCVGFACGAGANAKMERENNKILKYKGE